MSKTLYASIAVVFAILLSTSALAQFTPSDDSFTNSSQGNTNFGHNVSLTVNSTRKSYIRFDLSSIPVSYNSGNVAKASLKLYVSGVTTAGSFNAKYINAAWSETAITANTAPATGGTILTNINVTTSQVDTYILVDITSAVNAWLDGTQANNGIALIGNGTFNVNLESKENTTTSHPPELEIVFNSVGAQGPPGPAGPQGVTGATGPQGPPGVNGSPGPIGPQGPQGVPGTLGATGAQGLAGADGAAGPLGPQGPQGLQGTSGSEGPQGTQGSQGDIGPQGPAGPQGAEGASGATGAQGSQGPAGPASPNRAAIALLKWYQANQTGVQFAVGNGLSVAFDGTNIWVSGNNSLTKVRPSDGAVLGTYSGLGGGGGQGIVFDGANIWAVASQGVTKLRASDGTVLGTYSVVFPPALGLAFDGTNIWVCDSGNIVTKLRASDGATLGNFGNAPNSGGIAFDGANIWVPTRQVGGTPAGVSKLRASDGAFLGRFLIGFGRLLHGIAFDGSSLWVTDASCGCVRKLRPSDGTVLGTFAVGDPAPINAVFDGANVWVAGQGGTVTELRASDGAVLGIFSAGSNPYGIAFDGVNIWVGNVGSGTLSKL